MALLLKICPRLDAFTGVAALLVVALIGCGEAAPSGKTGAAKPVAQPKEVSVAVADLEAWPRSVRVQGSLLADEEAVIGSKLAGRVETVEVDLGSIVRKGETLVTLDRSELDLQVQLAEAQLRQATAAIGLTPEDDETELDYKNSPPVQLEQALVDEAQAAVNRAQGLLPTRAITGGEYDTLIAQLRAAKARYNSALNSVGTQASLISVRRAELSLVRQQIVDSRIVAPFDGVVEARRTSPGEYLAMGQPVISLVRADRLRLTAGVPESRAREIKPGQRVEIRVAGVDEPIVAAVTRVSPIVTQTSRSVRIEADVPNPGNQLQAGLFAEADVIVDADSQALALPELAVTRFAGVEKVWLVADGEATQQSIRTGRQERGRIEILDGLPVGSQVVADADQGRSGPVKVTGEAVSDQLSAISRKIGEAEAPPKKPGGQPESPTPRSPAG